MRFPTVRRLVAGVALTACVGCGGGGGGASTTTPPPVESADIDGYAFGGSRALLTGQTPLAGAQAVAYTLPVGSVPVATATTSSIGRFAFSDATSNALPDDRTVLIRVTGSGRVVSGLLNTGSGGVSKSLNEVTHVAALALLAGGASGHADTEIDRYETAARQEVETELSGEPTLDLSSLDHQDRAVTVAARTATAAGSVTTNQAPQVNSVAVTPTELDYQGGTVAISVQADDPDGDPLTVVALAWLQVGGAPQTVPLSLQSGAYVGGLAVAGNSTQQLQRIEVAIMVDDGRHAGTPAAVRVVSLLQEGSVTLDVLTETLYDEPASRARMAAQLDRMRAVWRRGETPRQRQVNPNQSIRGAAVVVDDQPEIKGTTDANGLLLLDLPRRFLDDRVVFLTSSVAGRAPYRHLLVIPQGVSTRPGDIIEIDLVLATPSHWQQLAVENDLGALDFGSVPLVAFFNVINTVNLGGLTPAKASFRPIAESVRPDDGDYLATNLPAGQATISGIFANPDYSPSSPPFGPHAVTLSSGTVHAVSALFAPVS